MSYELKLELAYGTLEFEFDDMKEFEEKLAAIDVERMEDMLADKFGEWEEEEDEDEED